VESTPKISYEDNSNHNSKESIISHITKSGITFQEICDKSMLSVKDVLMQLTVLEVSGYIKKVENKFFKV
jgi:predicted Rossmann fold nucleotide-binding protein DprA/Smf involved in DNA uptake